MTLAAPDQSLDHLPFKPMTASVTALLAAVTVAATTSAANATLPVGDGGNNQIEIVNASTGVVSLNLGTAAVAAVVAGTGYQVLPGQRRVITVDPYMTTVSVLTSIAGNVSFQRGRGMN